MKQRLWVLISLVEVMWIERIWIWNHGFRFDSSEGMLPKQRIHPIIPRINFLPPVKFCKNRSWMSWLKLMPKSHQNDRSLYFHRSIPIFNTWRVAMTSYLCFSPQKHHPAKLPREPLSSLHVSRVNRCWWGYHQKLAESGFWKKPSNKYGIINHVFSKTFKKIKVWNSFTQPYSFSWNS